MATITVTEKTFNKTIEKGVTLVDFWATWCPPCQMQSPVLEELSDELEGKVIIGKAPVVILFYKNKEIHRQARIIDFEELEYRIKQLNEIEN